MCIRGGVDERPSLFLCHSTIDAFCVTVIGSAVGACGELINADQFIPGRSSERRNEVRFRTRWWMGIPRERCKS